MADLALASPVAPAAASPLIAALALTPARSRADAAATDPFALLMAAATPPSAMPVVALPIAAKSGDALLPDVSEKTGEEDTAKDDGGQPGDPDALLALLTPPPVAPQPIPATPAPQVSIPTFVSAPMAAAPQAPSMSVPTAQPMPLPAAKMVSQAPPALPQAIQPTSLPATTASPANDPAPTTPATQTSIQAIVQMMTAAPKAESASQQPSVRVAVQPQVITPDQVPQPQLQAQQPAAQAAAPQAATPQSVTSPTAIAAAADPTPTPATIAVATTDPLPLPRAVRFAVSKLDGVPSVPTKAQATPVTNAAPAVKTDGAPAKTETKDRRDPAEPTIKAKNSATPEALPQVQDAPATPREVQADTNVAGAGPMDAMVTRHLDMTRDGRWLDGLAKDIAAAGGNNGSLSFTLSPENLGALKVDILAGADGASVHLTTETDAARNIIQDAQPRLAAEARAQGLTIRETSVSTNSDPQGQTPSQQQQSAAQSNGQQPGQDRRAFAQAIPLQPIAPNLPTPTDETSDGDLYA